MHSRVVAEMVTPTTANRRHAGSSPANSTLMLKPMEKKLFNEPKQRLKDGRYCSDEQKRIEMSIDRCKLLEMQLQTERRKVIALTERNVQLETKYMNLIAMLKRTISNTYIPE